MLEVSLEGKGKIDNAVIFLEDPMEVFPFYLEPKSDTEWGLDDIPVLHDNELDYSLHVQAFSGTGFTCVVTDKETDKTVTIEGVTGKKIKNYAHEKGAKEFE